MERPQCETFKIIKRKFTERNNKGTQIIDPKILKIIEL